MIAKRPWVYRKLADKDALTGPPIVKQFVEGEGFAYLGRSYRLTIRSGDDSVGVRLEGGRFHLDASGASRGAELMRRWYTEAGSKWLQRRILPWASRLGEPDVTVEVRDLGYRWGSARPSTDTRRINMHWATLQLPPTLIDYILVHELAHLHETNHTPEFWSIVARLMPSYETQKNHPSHHRQDGMARYGDPERRSLRGASASRSDEWSRCGQREKGTVG